MALAPAQCYVVYGALSIPLPHLIPNDSAFYYPYLIDGETALRS
jgi:hypothetical protein